MLRRTDGLFAMKRPLLASLLLFLLVAPAFADGEPPVPETITFVVSTGYWEEPADTGNDEADEAAAMRRGYYKLIAVRQPDGTAAVHLQQIESTAGGPKIASSTELEEFSALKPYVT